MACEDGHHLYGGGGFAADDIVVSGMSGRFPECESVGELKDALINQDQLIFFKRLRYGKGAYGMPYDSCGSIANLDKLDADYFCFPFVIINTMDPGQRKHLEITYEAIADAGYDPVDFKGRDVGVYTACISEDSLTITLGTNEIGGLQGLRSMHANRTSFIFDFQGPSYSLDSACSSSATAFWAAYNDLKEDRVSAAVVTGLQVNLDPAFHQMYYTTGVCTKTGNSLPLDANTDGMIRCEAATAVFLQKAKHARRVYATVLDSKFYTSGYNPEGFSVPSRTMQKKLFHDMFRDSGVSADDIGFVETHGTGTPVGDPIELNAIAEAYDVDHRTTPLYVGSVKSNVGHTEASSALCGYIKAMLCFETNTILPNRNYTTPNPGSPALVEGKLVVPTEQVPLQSPYIPVNSFGLGGTVTTTLFKQNPNTYVHRMLAPSGVPRMVLFPGTTEEAITSIFEYVKANPDLPAEFFALLNKLSFCPPFLKLIRGYAIFDNYDNPLTHVKKLTDSKKRPVWYIMTGMGSQWAGMGLQLMQIDVFAQSMRRSAEVLKSKFDLDLFDVIKPGSDYFTRQRDITPTFVALAAIQMALIDVLSLLDIHPDGMVGHSAGELLCTYADGCCTQEEVLICAYWRGKSVDISDPIEGAMAAVGLSWEEAVQRCPEGVYAACDNADDSVTISGPTEQLEQFVARLQEEKVFARTVNTSGYAFHSPYINEAGPVMKRELEKIITTPRPRSSRWISTCYTEEELAANQETHAFSAEYFTHNLLSRVRFTEAVKKMPKDCVAVEIGPHALLQSLVKRTLGAGATYVGLMKRNDPDNMKVLMEAIGKLYVEGVDPKIERLYPPVQFPVPRNTPMISSLIRWNHASSFNVPVWKNPTVQFIREVKIEREESYILDHTIDGRPLFPATGYVLLAWEALARKLEKNFVEVPVCVENFKIHRATILNTNAPPRFSVNIHESSGGFEICEGNAVVASGVVHEGKSIVFGEEEPAEYRPDDSAISGKDIYSELKMAGYEYGPAFQNLVEISMDGSAGLVSWEGRWIPFLDTILLFFGVISNCEDFCLPTGALYFRIDPTALQQRLDDSDKADASQTLSVPVTYDANTRRCRTLGVEISNLSMDSAPLRDRPLRPTLEEYKFVPNESRGKMRPDAQAKLDAYMAECNRALDDIGRAMKKELKMHKFPTAETSTEEDPLEEVSTSEHALLNVLREVSQNGTSLDANRKKNLFEEYRSKMGNDMLNCATLNDDCLRLVLELVLENSFKKVSALEVNSDFPAVLPRLASILKEHSHGRVKGKVLLTAQDLSEQKELLDEQGIQLLAPDNVATFVERQQEVIIGSFAHGSAEDLTERVHTLASVCKPKGFILLFRKDRLSSPEKFLAEMAGETLKLVSEESFAKTLEEEKLVVVAKVSDPYYGALYLLRPVSAEETPYVIVKAPEDGQYKWVEDIKRSLVEEEGKDIWIVVEDSEISGIVGMVNCLKQEPGGERVRCVFISDPEDKTVPPFSFEDPFYQPLLKKDLLLNVWRDRAWGTYRHILIKKAKEARPVSNCVIACRKIGDLSSFEWQESSIDLQQLQPDEGLVHVYYSPLNFKDVMIATGKINLGADAALGLEFSGRDVTGRRIAGFLRRSGLATTAVYHNDLVYEVPEDWTLAEAATVTAVYMTCYYGLLERGQLVEGESVLIHSATGGIGQAAIAIALSLRCTIFATVGSDEKREYLKKRFPQIADENIGCSRNTSFETMIMKRTQGKGVDVVLNSLADDKLLASVRCVGKHGRFIEIGKYDSQLDRPLGLKYFLKNASFVGVHVDAVFTSAPTDKEMRLMKRIVALVRDGVAKGVVKPLEQTIFERDQVEDAFRYMAKGVHVGKVMVRIRDEESQLQAVPDPLRLPAIPQTFFYPAKTYIVVGGLGGFGIEVTKWILRQGGRHVLLTSRYGQRVPYHHLCLRRWKDKGYDVRVSTHNVAIKEEAEKLILEANEIGSVGGIFNSAVVLKDAFIDCQTPQAYEEVCAPKAAATVHLDELSRRLCPSLDHFVCFSSISCGRGNAGQTNYGYANSVMERVCERRQRDGLHGLSIQWGIIGEVGVVHRHMGDDAKIAGVCAQSVKSCVDAMDAFLTRRTLAVASSYVAASQAKKTSQGDVLAHISKVLGVNSIEDLNTSRSFGEMGIDSMVGVELKQLLEASCDVTLTMQEIQEMRIDDVRALLEKAEAEKSSKSAADGPQLVSTVSIRLPKILLHAEPLHKLNREERQGGLPIFVVSDGDPGQDFKLLAESLTRPLYLVFWTAQTPTTSLAAAAKYYIELIRMASYGEFQLVGVGFSGLLALEMGRQSMFARAVTLLEAASDTAKLLAREDEGADAEAAALGAFIRQFVPGDTAKLEQELTKASNLEQRIKLVLEFLTASTSQALNKSEVVEAIHLHLTKAGLIRDYAPEEKFAKVLHVIEDPAKVLANDIAEIKTIFSQVCSGKVIVHRSFGMASLLDAREIHSVASILETTI